MSIFREFTTALRREEEGALTFEWILLSTLLVIGVIGGLANVRDAIVEELADVADAALHLDMSFTIPALVIDGEVIIPEVEHNEPNEPQDENPLTRCERRPISG